MSQRKLALIDMLDQAGSAFLRQSAASSVRATDRAEALALRAELSALLEVWRSGVTDPQELLRASVPVLRSDPASAPLEG